MTTKVTFECKHCSEVVGYHFINNYGLTPAEITQKIICVDCQNDAIVQGEQQMELEQRMESLIEGLKR